MRDQVDIVIGDQEKSARLLRKQITAQLKELDTKQENLIDLAADSTLPRTKVKERLRIASERRRLEGRLASCTDAATTSSGVCSTKRSSKPSTSRTRRSQTVNSRNPSGPPAVWVAFARLQASRSYFVAFIQALF